MSTSTTTPAMPSGSAISRLSHLSDMQLAAAVTEHLSGVRQDGQIAPDARALLEQYMVSVQCTGDMKLLLAVHERLVARVESGVSLSERERKLLTELASDTVDSRSVVVESQSESGRESGETPAQSMSTSLTTKSSIQRGEFRPYWSFDAVLRFKVSDKDLAVDDETVQSAANSAHLPDCNAPAGLPAPFSEGTRTMLLPARNRVSPLRSDASTCPSSSSQTRSTTPHSEVSSALTSPVFEASKPETPRAEDTFDLGEGLQTGSVADVDTTMVAAEDSAQGSTPQEESPDEQMPDASSVSVGRASDSADDHVMANASEDLPTSSAVASDVTAGSGGHKASAAVDVDMGTGHDGGSTSLSATPAPSPDSAMEDVPSATNDSQMTGVESALPASPAYMAPPAPSQRRPPPVVATDHSIWIELSDMGPSFHTDLREESARLKGLHQVAVSNLPEDAAKYIGTATTSKRLINLLKISCVTLEQLVALKDCVVRARSTDSTPAPPASASVPAVSAAMPSPPPATLNPPTAVSWSISPTVGPTAPTTDTAPSSTIGCDEDPTLDLSTRHMIAMLRQVHAHVKDLAWNIKFKSMFDLPWNDKEAMKFIVAFVIKSKQWGKGSLDNAKKLLVELPQDRMVVLMWSCNAEWYKTKLGLEFRNKTSFFAQREKALRQLYGSLTVAVWACIRNATISTPMTWEEVQSLAQSIEGGFFGSGNDVRRRIATDHQKYVDAQLLWWKDPKNVRQHIEPPAQIEIPAESSRKRLDRPIDKDEAEDHEAKRGRVIEEEPTAHVSRRRERNEDDEDELERKRPHR